MKRECILVSFLLISVITNAQLNAPVPKKDFPKIYNEVIPLIFESGVVQGKLNLNKIFSKNTNSNTYNLTYTVSITDINNSAKEKSLQLKLSKEFFESGFLSFSPEISDKSAYLRKFVQDKNLSLTEEKEWVTLIKYFNYL